MNEPWGHLSLSRDMAEYLEEVLEIHKKLAWETRARDRGNRLASNRSLALLGKLMRELAFTKKVNRW